ncbi:MAG: class I SAM-dependent methyltransferase [Deltaproteobacteria bacterium]|nr:class I SAM-dependent methyltransferase [Deltaproteobacteria bacterium]
MTPRTPFESYARFAAVALPPALVAVAWLVLRDFEHLEEERRMHQAAPTAVVPSAPPPPSTVASAPPAVRAASAPSAVPAASAAQAPSPPSSAVFEHIYEAGVWGVNAEGRGTSGSGSTLEATRLYRAYLEGFIKEHHIRSVVDAGCGDWEFSQAIDWKGIDYKGYDVAATVIERNKAKYTAPNVHFFVADVANDELPPADLVLSKHVLQHLPNAHVAKFFAQLPKYRHALITSSVLTANLSSDNPDILTGKFRPLDPTRPPFSVDGVKTLTWWDGHHMHQVVHVARK